MSFEVSVAPMMDWTDRHCRYFLRLIAPNIKLYTEMVTAQAIAHGDRDYLLGFDSSEHPIVLQLGGSDKLLLADAARIGEQYGYDEINLNVGCPSPRVSKGRFGACLMLEPQLVAECITAMQAAVNIPVTVKCRIGVDEQDSYEQLCAFIKLIAKTGCKTFVIHARKAWLQGLSPKENREIPPLHYDTVWRIKQDFSHLTIIINGGIISLEQVDAQLPHVDGVMIGRAAYHNPWLLTDIQNKYFKQHLITREEVVRQYLPYAQQQLDAGVRLSSLTRHILGLFQGVRGASTWRRYLSQHTPLPNAGAEVIEQALEKIV